MVRVDISRSAMRTLRRLDKATAKRILAALKKLEEDPDRADLDVRPLKARPGFRLRIGSWRVIFERQGDTITVLAIRPRGQAYR